MPNTSCFTSHVNLPQSKKIRIYIYAPNGTKIFMKCGSDSECFYTTLDFVKTWVYASYGNIVYISRQEDVQSRNHRLTITDPNTGEILLDLKE